MTAFDGESAEVQLETSQKQYTDLETINISHGFSLEVIQERLAERNAAKAAKDYARADAIRAELAAQGIILKDTAGGTEWHYE